MLILSRVEGFDIHFILIYGSIFIHSETPKNKMCALMNQLAI